MTDSTWKADGWLRRDAKGPEVALLQKALAAANFPPGEIDGDFGRATASAVVALQQSLGLIGDGIVGPLTAKGLEEAAQAGREMVLLYANPFDPSQRHIASCVPEMEGAL